MGDADGDVAQAAQVAQGDLAEAVHLVAADAVVEGRRLPAQKSLEGLVEALDFAAGLRVVGSRVFEGDTEAFEFQLEQDPALAGPTREDSSVVAEQGSR